MIELKFENSQIYPFVNRNTVEDIEILMSSQRTVK